MGASNAARQRRWQARNLIKMTATAEEIAAKLIGIPDTAKLIEIEKLLFVHLMSRTADAFEAEAAASRRPGETMRTARARVWAERAADAQRMIEAFGPPR
jgi:hypothetical protein